MSGLLALGIHRQPDVKLSFRRGQPSLNLLPSCDQAPHPSSIPPANAQTPWAHTLLLFSGIGPFLDSQSTTSSSPISPGFHLSSSSGKTPSSDLHMIQAPLGMHPFSIPAVVPGRWDAMEGKLSPQAPALLPQFPAASGLANPAWGKRPRCVGSHPSPRHAKESIEESGSVLSG